MDKSFVDILEKKGYIMDKLIGEGGYSKCFKVLSKKYNRNFVCKVLFNPLGNSNDKNKIVRYQNIKNSYIEEIKILGRLIHQNVISLYDYFVDNNFLFMVIDWCQNGSIEDILKRKKKIPKNLLIDYTKQILDGLEYCHLQRIAHHDIKPGNILIDDNFHVRLADFGLARDYPIENKSINHFGTIPYMAPEVLIKNRCFDPFRADLWALGVTLYQMTTGKLPFVGSDVPNTVYSIQCGKYEIPSDAPLTIRKVIAKCLSLNPKERGTIQEVKEIFDKLSKAEKVTKSSQLLIQFHSDRSSVKLKNIKESPKSSSLSYSKTRLGRSFYVIRNKI